jgi:hypothetical protein
MDVFKSDRDKNNSYMIKHIIFWPLAVILVTQFLWQPCFYNWRCERIASELEQQYDLVVRFGDPSEFYIPPLSPLVDVPSKGFLIEPSNSLYAITALKGVSSALEKYPLSLIKKNLKAIFISGMIKSYGVQIGGSYFNQWIYLSALEGFENESDAVENYEEKFHHELSSLFLKNAPLPTIRWHLANEPGFKYLPSEVDVIHAASQENRRDPKEATSWYKAGFVHDYGMSSMENDFNMYAALAMTHPEELKKLAYQYPRIQAKTCIIVDFYSDLAPELGGYMASVGLNKAHGSNHAQQEKQ